jgi:FkbM family methyltransferase
MPTTRSERALAASIRKTGVKIDFFKQNALARRLHLMQRRSIDLVLDLGANTGQYARGLRRAGYEGRIISFEPLSSAFTRLARNARKDPLWRAERMGLGARDHEATLKISPDSRASSLRDMLPRHRDVAPYFAPVAEEQVPIRKLDTVWDSFVPARSKVYLKIDTQGYEKQVLQGAARSLAKVRAIQMEISIQPLYDGDLMLPDVLRWMKKSGFSLISLEYGFCDPETAEMLQVDGIFARE